MFILLIVFWVKTTFSSSNSYETLKIPLKLYQDTPFIRLNTVCSQNSYGLIQLMLDTGSQQFWLSDNQCNNCFQTGAFCPHITSSATKITYLKGHIEGSDSFLNLCGHQYKFLCIKYMSKQVVIENGHGVLGLRVKSIGVNFIEREIYAYKKQDDKNVNNIFRFIFVYTDSENYLVFNPSQQFFQTTNPYIRIKCNQEWKFQGHQITFQSTYLKQSLVIKIQKYQILIDSGSSFLVFPNQVCNNIFNNLKADYSVQCISDSSGIFCSRLIDIQITLIIYQKHKKLSLKIGVDSLLDRVLNRYKINCLESNEKNIILGFPMFMTYGIGFSPNDSTIQIFQYKNIQQQSSSFNSMFFFMIYVFFIGIITHWTQKVVKYFEEKRSVKIII